MAPAACVDEISAADLFLRAVAMVPVAHYLAASLLGLLILFYNLFEFHFLRDLLHGFRGDPVVLTFNPASKIYEGVVSKCRIFHQRYLPTPWLASPHLQTAFLHFFGRPPCVTYRRQLFSVCDGGTIALDWLLASDVAGGYSNMDKVISKDDTAPLVIVIPGLTSDSASPYIKHLTYVMAKQGWNVVVSNHRGLAGISITSDCFYNAGWTEDIREVINHLHQEYPKAHLFAVGTSVGANILVKYLGEDADNSPVAGAASICSPWDLVVCDRFLTRKPVQRLYNRALTMGLKDYAKLHKPVLARLANWEGIRKSCSVREFDSHATCLVGKFETVDTFYRCCSSVNFTGNIVVPLLCISALDDPLCTREAIPWDECRANKNIVLATTAHGGHLAYFKGLTAQSLWWVEAVREFLSVLHASPFIHGQKKASTHGLHSLLESSVDKGPFVNVMEDGMVAAMTSDGAHHEHKENSYDPINHDMKPEDEVDYGDQSGERTEVDADLQQSAVSLGQRVEEESYDPDVTASVTSSMNQLSRRHRTSMWLLTYIAIVTTWPLVGSVLHNIFRKKLKGFLPAARIRR
ncbi:hypothetical protein OPV22_015157 [Ensete ventricosum]|uniref:AB hydrolase-1 domain-containing protein n=1 Tax=Ensete ventricosum TaxID=4639 RepID=A0AAV8R8T2_ENSVE|nr:hypothetical protein OPV22_015157 [Ensete ventricosum]